MNNTVEIKEARSAKSYKQDASHIVLFNGVKVASCFSRASAERVATVLRAVPAGQEPDWLAVRGAM